MRTPCSRKGTRAAFATFATTGGNRDSPKGRPFVLICSSFERKPQKLHVGRKDRHMEVRRTLQTDLGDGCIRRCGSAWASWKEVYERPSSRCADPRLVVTHRFSWAKWCKGWQTLPSYRLEGPVPSRPSPVDRDGCAAPRHPDTVQAGTAGPPTYPR